MKRLPTPAITIAEWGPRRITRW